MTTSTPPPPAPTPHNPQLSRALAASTRPERASALSASLTFTWRTLLKIKHVPDQMGAVILTPLLFTLMFTYLFGGALAGSTSAYLQYFLPGVVVLAVVLTSMYTGMSLNLDITKGVFDRFRSLPIWRPAVLVGSMIGDSVRYAIASVVPVLIGLLIGFRPGGGVAGVLLALLFLQLFTFSLAWVWTLFGVLIASPTAMQSATLPIQFVLVFGSNILVDPGTMPGWLEALVEINPVSHATTAVRGLMGGTVTAGQMALGFLSCAVLVALFAPPTSYLYHRKQRHG